jgi:hypothetical protein
MGDQPQAIPSFMDVVLDNKAIKLLENRLLTESKPNIYIALEDVEEVDFFWSEFEVKRFDRLWKNDMPIEDIAKELHRSEIAVFLLSLDRVFQGKVKGRNWKIW